MIDAAFATLPLKAAGDSLPAGAGKPMPARPENPDMREGVNIWFAEDNGEFAFPRLAVDATGEHWDNRLVCANVSLNDGRVFDGWGMFPRVPTEDADGNPTIVGCSVLQFRCIEPLKKWHVTYADEPLAGTIDEQIAKQMDPAKRAAIRLDAEITVTSVPWAQYFAPGDTSFAARAMGVGWRYEVPVAINGTFEVDGKPRPFKGTGVLIHRHSIRDFAGFWGHDWQAAAFPDGSAFGCNVYPEKAGQPDYNTGYIYKDGKCYNARVVEAPWLTELKPHGSDVSLVLESELGRTRIEGTTMLCTFKPQWDLMGGLSLEQSAVQYRWGDQTAIGIIERSCPV